AALLASRVINRKIVVFPDPFGPTRPIFSPRLITREEEPDAGQIAIDRGVAIGHFSQDIGEMKDQSVLEAALDGAGAVSAAARELHELEHALADPARADEMETLIERYREAASRFESLGGYGLEARARTVLAGLGFAAEQVDGD